MQRVQWRRVIQLKAPPPWHIRVLSSVPGKVILCLNVVKILGRPICAVNAEKFVFVRIFGVCVPSMYSSVTDQLNFEGLMSCH